MRGSKNERFMKISWFFGNEIVNTCFDHRRLVSQAVQKKVITASERLSRCSDQAPVDKSTHVRHDEKREE